MIRRIALVFVVFVTWSALVVGQQTPPQTPPPGPRPQFKSTAEILRLDVSVLDKTRLPVRNLTIDDFIVTENGKPQPLTAFAEVLVPDPIVPTTAWMKDIEPDIKRNDDLNDRRLIVIVLDDAQISSRNMRIAENVKAVGRSIIDNLGPADLTAIIYTQDSRNMQEFTTDRARLLAAVDRFHPGMDMPGGEELFMRYSVETLERAAEYLADIPNRRKALFYVSQGVNVDVTNLAPVSATPRADIQNDRAGQTTQLMQTMNEVFRKAQIANVNIHAIDPGGLTNGAQGIFDARKDFLFTVSQNTGGFPIVNNENYREAIGQVFLENSSYYLLGYEPLPPADGKFRRLDFKVKGHPEYTVRSRSGYYAPDGVKAAKSDAAKNPTAPLVKAISGLLPVSDLPLQVSAAAFGPVAGKKESTVAVVLGIIQDVNTGGERQVERIDFLIDAFGQDGSLKSAHGLNASVTLKPNIIGKVGYEVLSRIDLKPGRYQLRLSANLPNENKSGSIYYDVDVPDFTKTPLTLSGAMLSATPSIIAAPRDKLADLIPIVPTTNRYFRKSADTVTGFVRVYQTGKGDVKPVVLASRVTDSKGITVVNRVTTLPVLAFGQTRSAPVQFPVPIASLPPGAYLLTFDASIGTVTARRDIRFVIQ